MKTQVENVTEVKKVIHFEIPWEDVDVQVRETVRQISRNARIPGFRPGKAPESLIRTRYAEHIKEDVLNHVIPRAYRQVVDDNHFDVVSEPALHDVMYSEGSPFLFKVTIETRPHVEPKDFRGIELKAEPAVVKDEDVEAILKSYQERAAELIPLDTPSAKGNFIHAHVKATLEKRTLFDRRTMIEIGAEENHPAFNEHLTGRKGGETAEFDALYPEDASEKIVAGKNVHYVVTVESVNDRRLPSIDDEFAKDLGEFSSLPDLKDKIRRDLQNIKESERRSHLKDEILKAIVERNAFEVPESLVQKETERLLHDYAHALQRRGVDLQDPKLDWQSLQGSLSKQADQNIRGTLLIEAIARLENIEVNEADVDQSIQQIADQSHRAPESVKAELIKEEKMESLKNRVRISKTLDFLLDQAIIKE